MRTLYLKTEKGLLVVGIFSI